MIEYEDVFCIVANCAECRDPIYIDEEFYEIGIEKVHGKCLDNFKRKILTFKQQEEIENG